MKTVLSVKGITKTYPGGKKALHAVHFDLCSNQLVGLIGANGAGKSTLIHIIAGVLKQDGGYLYCNIQDANELAWVSQFSSIDWYLPVIDNVRLGARLGGYSFKKSEEISNECLAKVELQHKSHCQPDVLSGGEQRRMQIARALAQNPKILILDEPTVGLDPIASKKLMQSLRALVNQNCLVIIASHDLHLIEEEVDQILLLKEGKLIANTAKSSIINEKTWIRIAYEGRLNETVEKTLSCHQVKIHSRNPLEIECTQEVPFKKIFEILFSYELQITDIKISKNNLHQYYLTMNEAAHVS